MPRTLSGNGRIEKRGDRFLLRVNTGIVDSRGKYHRVSRAADATTRRGAEKELREWLEVVEYCLNETETTDIQIFDDRLRELERLAATRPEGVPFVNWAKDAEAEAARMARAQTVGEYARSWHLYRAENVRLSQSTIKHEACVIERIDKYLGSVMLDELDADTVKRAYSSMREDGISDDGILRFHKLIKRIMETAEEDELISKNPVTRRRVPTPKAPEKTERKSLDLSSVVLLSGVLDEAGDTDPNIICVRLGLATGMRLGEVLGLTWDNIDLMGFSLDVTQQFNQYGDITATKTESSKRTVSLDSDTVGHLLAYKEEQRKYLAELMLVQSGSTPVVINSKGEHLDPCNFRRWFQRFCCAHGFGMMYYEDGEPVKLTEYEEKGSASLGGGKGSRRKDGNGRDENGKPYSRCNPKPKRRKHYEGLTFHQLRHTQATQMLAAGTDIKTIQSRLGHSKASTTLDLYSHAIPQKDREAAEMWGELMAGKCIR